MKTLANFLTQPNQDFPLDCETMACIQELAELPSVIGNIAGDKVILTGCESDNDGLTRSGGYLFLRTKRMPEGEILWWEGGSTALGMYVREADVSVDINNVNYPKAYTTRSLAPGIGEENYSWDDFSPIKTVKELMQANEKLKQELDRVKPSPLGIIEMWAGINVPDGFILCNGQQLRKSDYPELYEVLGDAFNTAPNSNGDRYVTQSDYFRVPDLRGRFVVGHHDTDSDYKALGTAGGFKKVTLTEETIPPHSHTQQLWAGGSGTWKGHGGNSWPNATAIFEATNTDHKTLETGGGKSHENRPPYYVLAYIMRVK